MAESTTTKPKGMGGYLRAIYNNIPLVYAAGGNAWKQDFWNNYQNKGLRTDYQEAFSGTGWTSDYFQPTYPLHPTQSAQNMFARSALAIDLSTRLQTLGIEFSTEDATDVSGVFYNTQFTRVPKVVLGGSLLASVWHLYSDSSNLVTIDEIEITQDFVDSGVVALWSQCFENCNSLKNLKFSGAGYIDKNIDLHWSTQLTKTSINNVVAHLSSTTSDLICGLSLAAVNAAFETSSQANDGTASAEWLALIDTKPNWSFALV